MSQSSVVFFPWLEIRDAFECEEFEVLKYERNRKPFGRGSRDQSTLDAITKRYCIPNGQPIKEAAIMRLKNKAIFDSISEEDRYSAFRYAEILAFSSLSERIFFHNSGYFNQASFSLVVQNFMNDLDFSSVQTRRRDGSRLTAFAPGVFQERRPLHATSEPVRVNANLVTALLMACSDPKNSFFEETIFYFNRANTDDERVPEQSELVMLTGAFELLFDCHRGKVEELAERFAAVFQPRSRLEKNAVRRIREMPSPPKSSSVAEIWLRDMVKMRHAFAHGKKEPRNESIWDLREHLLLGTFVFPLVMKIRLAGLALYSLTANDKAWIDCFEELLAISPFEEARLHRFEWSKIVQKHRMKAYIATVLDDLSKIVETDPDSI